MEARIHSGGLPNRAKLTHRSELLSIVADLEALLGPEGTTAGS